jgi:hypothetical protein
LTHDKGGPSRLSGITPQLSSDRVSVDPRDAAKLDIRDRARLILVPTKPLVKSRIASFVILGSRENIDDFAGVPKGLVEGSEQMSLQGHLVVGHGRSLHAFQLTAAFRGAHNSRQRACGRLAAK